MLHFFYSNPALGIEVSSTSVRTVAVAGKGCKAQVLSAASHDLPGNAVSDTYSEPHIHDRAALIRSLNTLLGSARISRRAALCLPDSVFRVQMLEFDQLPAKSADRERLIRWRLEKSATFDLSDTVVRYQAIGAGEGTVSLLACVVKKKAIVDYEAVLLECGVEPWSIMPASFCAFNFYTPYLEKKCPVFALVHVSRSFFVTMVAGGGGPRFYRYKDVKRAGKETVSWQVREIEESLHFYAHRGQSAQAEVGCVVITGERTPCDALVDQLKTETALPVEAVRPAAVLSASPAVDAEMAPVLGAVQTL